MKKVSLFLTLLISVCLIFGFAFEKKAINDNYWKTQMVPDEIVVCFSSSTTEAEMKNLKNHYKMTLKKKSKKAGKFRVYKHLDPASILENLKKEKGVIYAEQNAYAYATWIPDDPYYPYQWHMTRIGMEDTWLLSTGSGVVVAIIDTGVKQTLEDLALTNFTAGYDFVNNDTDPTDDEGHGSHVCGTIAQSTNNAIGVTGVAYNATIMPVKVLDSTGSGTFTDIADGIYFATDNGADIINMSLGGSTNLSVLEDAVNYAWNNGVVIVCAAGNSSSSSPFYPAAYTNSISVSATGGNDALASYSNYGTTIDICAPGGDYGDYNLDGYDDFILQNTFGTSGDGYYFYAGTSMASPHVAGVAALVKAADLTLTNSGIRNILETTAEDLGAVGWDQYFGYGIVDAYAAVNEAQGGTVPDTTPPVISSVLAVNITYNSATITWTTDEVSDSVVYYGLTTSYGNTTSNSSDVTSHSIELTGLTADTLYHYKVESTDPSDNTSESVDFTFTTLADTGLEMYVDDITMSKISGRRRTYTASAVITIRDTDNNLVSDATVYITWSGVVSGTSSGVTGSDGTVTFTSDTVRSTGPFTITVTNVTHSTIPYNPLLNNETSDSI